MGWLRKQRDLVGLIAVWGILLQSLALGFTSGLHAATLTADPLETSIVCTSRGVPVTPDDKKQSNHGSGYQCCHMSCRQACGGASGNGILPTFARVPLPSAAILAIIAPRVDTRVPEPAGHAAAQPRAPPLA